MLLPSVIISHTALYLQMISLHRIWSTSSAVVLFVANASKPKSSTVYYHQKVLNLSRVTGCGPTKSRCILPNGSTTSKGFSGARFLC